MKHPSAAPALTRRLPAFVVIFCALQPLMDVLSYWLSALGYSNLPTLLLRFFLLVLAVSLGFCLTRKKQAYLLLAGTLALLTAGHIIVCSLYGYTDPIGDLTNLIRIYQLPLMTAVFITLYRQNRACIPALGKGFCLSLGVILVVSLLARLTGTDPYTYPNKSIGLLGWFSFANAQSAILSMAVPVALVWVMQRTRYRLLPAAGAGLVFFSLLFFFATRLAYAALLGCAFAFSGAFLLLSLREKGSFRKLSLLFAAFGLAALLLTGVSPMAENNRRVAENAQLKQADILALVEEDTQTARSAGLTGSDLQVAGLKSAYEKYLPGLTSRFGLMRTAAAYNCSTRVEDISNARLQRLNFCRMLQEEQPMTRIFGLELGRLSENGVSYDVENDFHGIFYLCGSAGLFLLLVFLGYFLVRILLSLRKQFRARFTPMFIGGLLSIVCGLAHAVFTAGVFRRPNANFYLAAAVALLWVLTESTPVSKEDAAL